MRFLCEQCKAKYQIADEKVAGKTVRMKCRKCGHLIEVKAEVTETSVASKAPPPPEPAQEGDDATRVGMDVGALLKSTQPAKAGVTKAQAPRPGAPAKPGLATSLAAAKPQKPATLPQQQHAPGALAGAFQKSVAHNEERALHEISTSSEWYVAINGVPVGPVRIAELRRKASTGAVDGESLVWQEGMEEWRPLRTVSELAAIVQEGLSAERPSLVTPAPPSVAPRTAPAAPHGGPQHRPISRSNEPKPAAARNNVVSLTSRLATAEKIEPEPIADPFAAKSPISGIDALGAPPAPSFDAPVFSPLSAAAPTVVISRKTGPNWVAVGMIVAFGAFGVTAGIAVFFHQNQPPAPAPTIVVTNQAPVATSPVGTGEPATSAAEIASGQPGVAPGAHTQSGSSGGTTGHAPSSSTTRTVDPSIAALLGGPGTGPAVGGGSSGGSASSALSEEAIQRTVQQRSAGVKRTCWERGGATQSNVNVRVHLSIAATGNVTSASADGNDPIVAKCIETSVRGWTFPVSSGSTTVDIPFHFLRQ